ncbi:hypothetical protein DSL64_13915 [Dyadobacter luteus]|jgi:hypothetical protein|uniref:Uncharacterized protein n=1 Tax=Dyadobacter luteus TaxID=2259619 RepID=A0A3D8YA92_9BACT|nr:hypothetical protein [Dyadobacter luteus]REA60633.1 hypothetical protein DSL64_13915 [Dyadobacter luteus]
MKLLTNISYNIGKIWLAVILFLAMIISTIVSLPFIVIGGLIDFFQTHKLKPGHDHFNDYYSG